MAPHCAWDKDPQGPASPRLSPHQIPLCPPSSNTIAFSQPFILSRRPLATEPLHLQLLTALPSLCCLDPSAYPFILSSNVSSPQKPSSLLRRVKNPTFLKFWCLHEPLLVCIVTDSLFCSYWWWGLYFQGPSFLVAYGLQVPLTSCHVGLSRHSRWLHQSTWVRAQERMSKMKSLSFIT